MLSMSSLHLKKVLVKFDVIHNTGFFLFQSTDNSTTVVAFLIFPTQTNNFNVDSLKGQAVTKQLRYVR